MKIDSKVPFPFLWVPSSTDYSAICDTPPYWSCAHLEHSHEELTMSLDHPLPYWATLGLWQHQPLSARAEPFAGTFLAALTTEGICHIHMGCLNLALLILISRPQTTEL